MKKGICNFGVGFRAALLNQHRQPAAIFLMILSTVVAFSTLTSPAAVIAEELATEQADSAGSTPKMGECQFYVKSTAVVNGKKREVLAGAGAYIETSSNLPVDAVCKGECNMKGPNGGECGCGYQSIVLPSPFPRPLSPNEAAGGSGGGLPPTKTLHVCECFELIGE